MKSFNHSTIGKPRVNPLFKRNQPKLRPLDLSKAFDCLPHGILLCKLSAYGLSPKSVELLRNYLTGRKQQIKLQGDLSSWANIQKGVPQALYLDPCYLNFLLTTSFILLNMVHCIIMLTITPCLM